MSVDIAQLGLEVRSDGVVVATKRLDALGRSAKTTETAVERLARAAEKAGRSGRSLQGMGRNLSLYLTAPLIAAAAASVKLGVDFGHTMSQMNTLVGVSRKELIDFRKEILKLGPSVGRGPIELADALFAITSAGQRGAMAMDTLTKAAKASAIGLGDTRQIALAATAAVQAYGTENMNSTKALEILIGTIEKGNLAAEELVPVMGRVIGIAAEMGVAFEDLGAFIATFSLLGVKADEAATSLRGVLSAIQAPTPDALQAFEDLGTNIDEVRKNIRDKGFIVTFQALIKEARRLDVDLVSLVPNVRALSGALGVFGGEGKIAEENLKGVSAAIGTLEDRIKAVEDLDPQHQINQMKAELEALMILLSEDLVPVFLEVVNSIRDMLKAFSDLDEQTQKTIIRFGGLALAAGPFLMILGSLFSLFGRLVPLLIKAGSTSALGSLTLGFRAIAGILMGPVGVVAGLGLLVYWLGDKYVTAMEDAVQVTGDFKAILGEIVPVALLRSNVDAALASIEQLKSERDILEQMINTRQTVDNNIYGSGAVDENTAAEVAELNAELETLNAIIAARQRMVDDHLLQIGAQVQLERDLAAAKLEVAAATGGAIPEAIKLTQDEAEALAALRDELDPAAKAMKELAKARALIDKAFSAGDLNPEEWDKLNRSIDEGTEAYEAYHESLMRIKKVDFNTAKELEDNMAYIDGLVEMRDQVQAIEDQLDPAAAALREFGEMQELVNEAFAKDLIDETRYKAITGAIEEATEAVNGMGDAWVNATQSLADAFHSMSLVFDEGSSEQKALALAAAAANTVLAVQAILNQAQGDPYSAFGRMAAMAALVAGLGVQVAGIVGSGGGSEYDGITDKRQTLQGTGSVLGDMEAKTESIINAAEITADATSELVGINRGMLHALQAMQAGISGATGSIARDADKVEFGTFNAPEFGDIFGKLLGSALGGLASLLFGKLFGGSSKVIDEGVAILAGSLQDAIDGTLIQAFETVKYKKWRWGSSKRKEIFGELPDEASRQIALVFTAIGDTVREGALALGMSLEDIEAAIATFQIDEVMISLDGMNAEEQQAELEAVFGQIFDNLAVHVIPWLDEFQQVGEGLGETLVRVATSVQVFQEAVKALGFAADVSNPKVFAEMAVGLVELTGGVENFISMFSTFFDTFASDEQKLAFTTDHLGRAFESVGLTIPETRDGMIDLMMSLDATTESGRKQIAMLLEIAGVADEYYSLVESAEEKRLKDARAVADEIARIAEETRQQWELIANFTGQAGYGALRQLTSNFEEAMAAADALGASQKEYAMIARAFDAQLRRMTAGLKLSVLNMADQLFGADGAGGAINEGLEETRIVANSVFEEWQRALESIFEYTQSLLLDEALTTLTPAEQLNEAQSQFDRVLAAAMGGDAEAAAALPEAAQALLEEARFMYASGKQYTDIFKSVNAALAGVGMPEGIEATIEIENDEYRMQGEIIADEIVTALERYILAFDLANELRNLAEVMDVSIFDLAKELGIPLWELVTALGVNLNDLSNETAAELAIVADILGVGFFDLIKALDIGLTDTLKILDIDLNKKWNGLMQDIIGLAETLGLSFKEIVKALDIPPPTVTTPREKDKYYYYKGGKATGGYVDQTGMHMLHAGEFVIDKNQNTITPAGGDNLNRQELGQIRAVLVDIKEQNRRYQDEDIQVSREMESSLKQSAEQARRVSNG